MMVTKLTFSKPQRLRCVFTSTCLMTQTLLRLARMCTPFTNGEVYSGMHMCDCLVTHACRFVKVMYYYYNDDDDAKLARATFLPQLRIAVMHAARESVRARDVLLRTFIHVCCRACVQRCVCLLRAQATTSHARAKAFFVNRCLHCQAPTRTPALWPITSSYSILTASLCD